MMMTGWYHLVEHRHKPRWINSVIGEMIVIIIPFHSILINNLSHFNIYFDFDMKHFSWFILWFPHCMLIGWILNLNAPMFIVCLHIYFFILNMTEQVKCVRCVHVECASKKRKEWRRKKNDPRDSIAHYLGRFMCRV